MRKIIQRLQVPIYKKHIIFFGICLLLLMSFVITFQNKRSFASENLQPKKLFTHAQKLFKRVCDIPSGTEEVRCHAHVTTDSKGIPQATSNPVPGSYGPAQFHTAYNLPCTPGGTIQSKCISPSSFGPQMIAIVDAYHNQTIENDLGVFNATYGLPACTRSNGCLIIVNQNGGSSLPKKVNSGWELEASLDVEVAHETCQTCKILLVETNSSSIINLGTGVTTAAKMGATAISNSYGASEWSGETSYDAYYNHPGIAVTVSSGDSGFGAEYPAASSNVIAVGGTSLQLFTDNTYASESVWSSGGSGCSSYENANSWQKNLLNWNNTGCNTKRSIADISADADPNTGASVFDSTGYAGSSGWWQVGGTSLASPLIASAFTLSGVSHPNTNAAAILYANNTVNNYHDIMTGSNGSCGTIMCNGAVGYDGPSGIGSPNGVSGFGATVPTPTPTNTPTPTFAAATTPTPTPSGLLGQYFANQTLSGIPTITRLDPTINFNWGLGSPDPSIPADHFSVRWTKTQPFSAGSYQFSVTADDGVRLYIDNKIVIDRWIDESATTYTTVQTLSAGNHTITMEYYENTGNAVAIMHFQQVTITPTPPLPAVPFFASYYNNQTLSGAPTITRSDPIINFNWGAGSPDPAIPVDHFSARWTKTDSFAGGSYTFTVTADDGVRLYIDNVLVIDKWIDQSPTTYATTQMLSSGSHSITMEYYENTGGAVAILSVTH